MLRRLKRLVIPLFILLGTIGFLYWFYTPTNDFRFNYRESDPTIRLSSQYVVKPGLYKKQYSQLPNLSELEWPLVQLADTPSGRRDQNGTVQPLPPAFNPVMSRSQRTVAKRLLKLFSDLMFLHGYGDRFMIYGGTLLGSFRHHDFIPWDDDVDVLVDLEIRPDVQKILKSLSPKYMLKIQGKRDKFYTKMLNVSDESNDYELSRHSSSYSWGWPYLDIAYYKHENESICDFAIAYGRRYCWPSEVIFPLMFRPLGDDWFPVPFMLKRFLELTYGSLEKCAVFGYSHILEAGGPSGKLSCKELQKRYAFVNRHSLPNSKCDLGSQLSSNKHCAISEESLALEMPNGQFEVIHRIELPSIDFN